MIYQDPLAYLLGLEGIALLDAWAGDHDREFVDARLAEIRRLLADEKLRGGGGRAVRGRRAGRGRVPQRQGAWRGARRRLRNRPLRRVPGPARASGHRRRQLTGHARARAAACPRWRVSRARLQPVLAEFARVLRPGGDLVISDVHHERVTRGSVITARGPAGEPCIAATYRHQLGDYLRPALSHGLQVRRCEEPTATGTGAPLPVPATEIGDWQYWPWSLLDYLPSAAQAAKRCPSLVIWHFQRPAG